MGLSNSNPQILVYWFQLLIAIPCIGLLGNHYGVGPLTFSVAITVILAFGTIGFLLLYSFRKTRPSKGRSIFKIVEIFYHTIAFLFYLIIIGIHSRDYDVERSRVLTNSIQVFTSFNFATYFFGGVLSLTEFIWESAEKYETERRTQIYCTNVNNATINRNTDDFASTNVIVKVTGAKRMAPSRPNTVTAHPAAFSHD